MRYSDKKDSKSKNCCYFCTFWLFYVKVEFDTRFLRQDHESGAASTMILHLSCRGVTPTTVLLLFRPCASTRPRKREGKNPSDPPEQQRSWRRRHSRCTTVRSRAWGPWWRTWTCRRGWCASLWRRLQLQVVNQVKETPHQPTAKGRCHKSYSSLYSKDVGGGRAAILEERGQATF